MSSRQYPAPFSSSSNNNINNKIQNKFIPFQNFNTNNNNNNKNHSNDMISFLDYKVSNPSSSLIMSSLLNMQQDLIDSHMSTEEESKQNYVRNMNKLQKSNIIKERKSIHKVNQDFYQYLIQEENINNNIQMKNDGMMTGRSDSINSLSHIIEQNISDQQNNNNYNKGLLEYIPPKNKAISTKAQYYIPSSLQSNPLNQSSLLYLQQSQQQLSYLKQKLQQAYEKLQKQILNSYQLQEKIQYFTVQLNNKEQLLQLERKQNEKLKFTLKAILKNKILLEQQIQKIDRSKGQKEKQQDYDKQNQLKEILRVRLEQKEQIKKYQQQVQTIKLLNQQLQEQNKKNSTQLLKKDKQLIETKQQNKKLLVKQNQYLNKINILQSQIRKVTDEKVTLTNRLKHEISLIQKKNVQLLQHNHNLQSQMHIITLNGPNNYSPNTITKRQVSKSCNRINNLSQNNMNKTHHTPAIYDSEEEDCRGVHQNHVISNFDESHLMNNMMMNNENINTRNINNTQTEINENRQSLLMMKSNQSKSVGKWKRPSSTANNSSAYYQSNSQHTQIVGVPLSPIQPLKSTIQSSVQKQNIQISPLSSINHKEQNEDQKLSKYQQHRKNIENELGKLEKVKRLTKEEREKMDKLEKQLYYLDSDIAGLKRKIRRKY